jgi:transposase
LYNEWMKKPDARSLSSEAQQALRERAVKAVVEQGVSRAEAARLFGVSRQTVSGWVSRFRSDGEAALAARKRGAPPTALLDPDQRRRLLDALNGHTPEEFDLGECLWTRNAVAWWAHHHLGVSRSRWVWGRWLKAEGFTPQRPARRAVQQDPEAVAKWLQEEYPAVAKRARAEGAEIHWLDEAGLRSECNGGRGYSPRGQTPVVPVTGKRFGVNFLATLTNGGLMRFLVYHARFTQAILRTFLALLLASRPGRKVMLILDRHPVHTSKAVAEWVSQRADRIELVFLPAYSPEVNPVEYLNNDVKANTQRMSRAKDKDELHDQLNTFLEVTAGEANFAKAYFGAKHVRYAA